MVHLMIREGEPDITLRFLAASPMRRLSINSFTDGKLLRCYMNLDWHMS